MRESEIQAAIRKALGVTPGVLMWRNPVGFTGHDLKCPKCGHVQPGEDGPKLKFGLAKGSADLVGLDYLSNGKFLALEVKTPIGRASPEQTQWLDLVRRRGGFATIVRSVDDALAAVERCRAGASE